MYEIKHIHEIFITAMSIDIKYNDRHLFNAKHTLLNRKQVEPQKYMLIARMNCINILLLCVRF